MNTVVWPSPDRWPTEFGVVGGDSLAIAGSVSYESNYRCQHSEGEGRSPWLPCSSVACTPHQHRSRNRTAPGLVPRGSSSVPRMFSGRLGYHSLNSDL